MQRVRGLAPSTEITHEIKPIVWTSTVEISLIAAGTPTKSCPYWCRKPDTTELQPFIDGSNCEGDAQINPSRGSSVDVSTMPKCDNNDQENPVVNRVQHAIILYSESISISTA